jgi:hypothetical protein
MMSGLHCYIGLAGALSRACRQVIAVLLTAAVMLAATHHLSCAGHDAAGTADIVSASDNLAAAPASDQDHCIPGHCHCACQASAESGASAISKPIQFADTTYTIRDAMHLRSVSVGPLFEPPCV